MKKILLITLSVASFAAFGQVKSLEWQVKKTSWSALDEKNFQEFVRGVGKAREKRICNTTDNCIKNKTANPMFAAKNPPGLRMFSDCADLPFILRGYFAWMNNLPFSYPTGVSKASPKETKPDIRYSVYGNKIISRKSVKSGDNVNKVLAGVSGYISSAAFRIHPSRDVDGPNLFNDFYPIDVSRSTIVPGTVVYDPNGHILVVYDIADDGRIFMIDAHPDNSLTRQVYDDKKFVISSPNYGAGFKNWRPVEVIGGAFYAKKNDEIVDFSTTQYYGNVVALTDTDWKTRKFQVNGEIVTFGDYVRRSLAKGKLKYEPVNELRESMKALCDDIKDRKAAVEDALTNGVHKKTHPVKLPENIYGTEGEWESFSTPSRDARLKAAVLSIKENIITFYNKSRNGDPVILYVGNDLVGDMKKVYEDESRVCQINYTNSKGASVLLNMDQIIERIYTLSFDPYHCIELRWGARESELSSCQDDQAKRAWFNAEQSLRNTIERNYDLRMDKSLAELPNSDLGISTAADLNLKKVLESLE